jgi:hypothetical protein
VKIVVLVKQAPGAIGGLSFASDLTVDRYLVVGGDACSAAVRLADFLAERQFL